MGQCGEKWTHIIPVIIFFLVPVGILITYAMAVGYEHVAPYWPYISDTGTFSPESCFFGLVLSIAAYLFSFMVYIRWREVREWVNHCPSAHIGRKANMASLILGLISCFGVNVVGNFQVTNVKSIHFLGAFLAFIPGTIYFIFQTVFTYKLIRKRTKLFCTRVALTVLTILATLGYIVPSGFANKAFKGSDKQKWKPEDGGYELHVVSSSMEWILVFSYFAYIVTFHWDFKNIIISEPPIKVLNIVIDNNGPSLPSYNKNINSI